MSMTDDRLRESRMWCDCWAATITVITNRIGGGQAEHLYKSYGLHGRHHDGGGRRCFSTRGYSFGASMVLAIGRRA